MNFIFNFIPEELIKAIGWTIFHSIWQGAVIAIIVGALLLLTGKKSARLRYNISTAAMFLFFFVSLGTFVQVYEAPKTQLSDNPIFVSGKPVQSESASVNTYDVVNSTKINLPEIFETYFAENLPLVVTFWFTGLIIFSLRFIGSVFYVQRIKTTGLHTLENIWHYRLNVLHCKLDLNRPVQIYESTQIDIPITIGNLKPIILLPLGIISGLPQDQIEAIISHELAHIKRYDFLINLIQIFIEMIFFYHPLVWWLSALIKTERENCCDDIAIETCGDAVSYSKALYNIQQIRKNEEGLALAAIGKKNQLYRRIIRMNTKNKNTGYGVRFAAFAVLLIAMAAISIHSSFSVKDRSLNLASASFVNPFYPNGNDFFLTTPEENLISVLDTASFKKGTRTLKFSEDDKRYKARLNNGKLDDLYIDGEKVQEKDLQKYESLVAQRIEEFDSAMKEYRQNLKDYRAKMKAFKEKMKKFRGNNGYAFDFDFLPIDFNVHPFDSSISKKVMEEIQKNMRENFANHSLNIPTAPPIHIPSIYIPPIHIPEIDIPRIDSIDYDSLKLAGHVNDADTNRYVFDKEAFNKSMKEWKENFSRSMAELKEKMKNYKVDMEKFKKEMKKKEANSETLKKKMEELKTNMGKLKANMKTLKEFVSDAKDEMMKDKLIEDSDDLDSFTLSKNELIVNGKAALPALHKKYLELYKKHYGKELKGDEKFQIDD